MELMCEADSVMCFDIKQNPRNAMQLAVRVSALSLGSRRLLNVCMNFGVRARRSLSVQNPLPNELGPIGATAVLRLLVDKQGEVKLPVRIQVGHKYRAHKATECGSIKDILHRLSSC
jgi:hypothetical protein